MEAGTPWILHSKKHCLRFGHIDFQTMAEMSTGEGLPENPVCSCGVSKFHLKLRGVVKTDTGDKTKGVVTTAAPEEAPMQNVASLEKSCAPLIAGPSTQPVLLLTPASVAPLTAGEPPWGCETQDKSPGREPRRGQVHRQEAPAELRAPPRGEGALGGWGAH